MDLKKTNDLLIKRGKARGQPIGISLFREEIPERYEPIQDVPCSIVRYARDEGRKVYTLQYCRRHPVSAHILRVFLHEKD